MESNLTKQIEDGMRAFSEFKSTLEPKLSKLDTLDIGKLNNLEKGIGDAIEAQQKQNAKNAALEAQVKELETLISRPNLAIKSNDQELITKAFGEFARSGEQKSSFASFLKANAKEFEQKDLSASSDIGGGYLVLPAFGGLVNTKVFESSPIRQLANVINIGTDTYEIVVDYDEISANWTGETSSIAATNTPALGKLIIATHELTANVQATQKILDDAVINIEGWLATKTAEYFGRAEATAFVTGDGVAKPRGINSYTAGTTISSGQIEQVNAGSTSAFTYAGLVNLQNALKEPYQANASWLMKRASFGSIMQIVTGISGDNRPIFNMMYDKNTGLQTSILARPLYYADDVAAISSASLSAIYGDIRTAYTIVDRIGLRVLRDPFTSSNYVKFLTTKRVGGGVVNFEAVKIQKMST